MLSPARPPFPSVSGGLLALGGVRERWSSPRRCRLGPRVSRLGFPVDAGEAVAAASRRNKSSRSLPRPIGASLRRRWRGRGGGTPSVECVSWSGAPSVGVRGRRFIAFQVWSLMPLFCLDVELSVRVLGGGWPDLASSSLGDGGRRSEAQIRESVMLGRRPGRWFIADGFILLFGTGVYFDSIASQRATGLLRLMVDLDGFSGGDDQRRGGRFQKDHEETMTLLSPITSQSSSRRPSPDFAVAGRCAVIASGKFHLQTLSCILCTALATFRSVNIAEIWFRRSLWMNTTGKTMHQ